MMKKQKGQKEQNKYYIELMVYYPESLGSLKYKEKLREFNKFTGLPRDLFNKVVEILDAEEVEAKIWARSYDDEKTNYLVFLENSRSIKDFKDLDELFDETNRHFKNWINGR